jgi:hypothetical protein
MTETQDHTKVGSSVASKPWAHITYTKGYNIMSGGEAQ